MLWLCLYLAHPSLMCQYPLTHALALSDTCFGVISNAASGFISKAPFGVLSNASVGFRSDASFGAPQVDVQEPSRAPHDLRPAPPEPCPRQGCQVRQRVLPPPRNTHTHPFSFCLQISCWVRPLAHKTHTPHVSRDLVLGPRSSPQRTSASCLKDLVSGFVQRPCVGFCEACPDLVFDVGSDLNLFRYG